MSQINGALEAFTQVLADLEKKMTQAARLHADRRIELDRVNEVCAHLRAEISVLKKDLKRQLAANEKAGREIDTLIADIDDALEQADG
ncbi:MAG: hypothetical protein ACON4J_08635 [Parvibaculales bacterium]